MYSKNLYSDDACYDSDFYKKTTNIIIFDGTTPPNDNEKKIFKEGVHNVTVSEKTFGRVEWYSIGPREYSFKKLNGDCIFPYDFFNDQINANNSSIFNTISDYIFPKPPIRDQLNKSYTGKSIAESRNDIALQIYNDSIGSIKEEKTTCLLNDIICIINDRYSDYDNINLFVFTDLTDSKLKKLISSNKINNTELVKNAQKTGREFVKNIDIDNKGNDKKNKKISFIFWGVGRNEYKELGTYNKEQLDRLKIYWVSFLQSAFDDRFTVTNIKFYINLPRQF